MTFSRYIPGLLSALAIANGHAQSMPPGALSPVDVFHQSCVAVRALPNALIRPAPGSDAMRAAIAPSPVPAPSLRHYVDLDNLCATPPAFAPTRDIDSTSVWYVDAPSGSRHAVTPAAGGLTS